MSDFRRVSIYTEGFAHRNPVPAACRKGPFLFSGVITGRDQRDRSLPPTLDEQLSLMFQAVRSVADAAGGATEDIVKMTFWLADLEERPMLNREWVAMFPDPNNRPTRHTMAGALEPSKLVECEFVAVLAGDASR